MYPGHGPIRAAPNRRTSLVAGGPAFCGPHLRGRACTPEDVAKTVYHAPGVDDLVAVDRGGKPFPLPAEGRPPLDLL